MNDKQIPLIIASFIVILGIFLYGKTLSPSLELSSSAPILPLPKGGNYKKDLATLVDYQASPKEPYFHAPCPIADSLQKEVFSRCQVIGFNKERQKRAWSGITKRLEEKTTDLTIFKNNIRDFIVLLIKLQDEKAFHLLGTSEIGDVTAFTRVAICDEVALAHHHIKDGIDPAISEDSSHANNIEISRKDRILFEILYRSCKMTALNAFRYAPGLLTRVSFFPAEKDWGAILTALNIDPKQANEVICTYKEGK